MKIGLVKHFNARPLTFGFEESGEHELVYDNPSVLKDLLLNGELDTALISSVECLRHKNELSYCSEVGVCSRNKVRSILFYKNPEEIYPPEKIYVDSGSRTSVALITLLVLMETGKRVETVPMPASEIMMKIQRREGSHMLFGDHALFMSEAPGFICIDLAEWWFRLTGKGFCFAFWAYPKKLSMPDSLFMDSLKYGLSQLNKIILKETRFPPELSRVYLEEELHYYLEENDRAGFLQFSKALEENGLLF
ncbi:MAG: hypothetical protein H7A25_10665 [Leptospiraceae bacterium]|nr:hypothetical protein [Leptospiraceae bacterium]